MTSIFVTNGTEKKLVDGFGGVKYEFKPGETVEVPIEVAKHVFGYGYEDKEPFLARLGWIKTTNDLEEGFILLSKWTFSDKPPQKNQSLSPLVERVPLQVVKSAKGKVLSVA
jgi:hypothetical protein